MLTSSLPLSLLFPKLPLFLPRASYFVKNFFCRCGERERERETSSHLEKLGEGKRERERNLESPFFPYRKAKRSLSAFLRSLPGICRAIKPTSMAFKCQFCPAYPTNAASVRLVIKPEQVLKLCGKKKKPLPKFRPPPRH